MEQFLIKNILFVTGGSTLTVLRQKAFTVSMKTLQPNVKLLHKVGNKYDLEKSSRSKKNNAYHY